MRATIGTVFAVLLLTSACGVDTFVAPAAEGGDGGSGMVTGGGNPDGGADAKVDAPPPPPNCDVTKLPTQDSCVIAEGVGVFVSSSLGSATGDGSRAHPFATLSAGIAAANKSQRRVYACAEAYPEQVQLAEGTSIFGYFDCHSAWVVGSQHAQVKAPASPAVTAQNIAKPTRVEAVDIVSPDFTSNAQTSIALVATASPGLTIAQARIHAGTGGNGAAGTDAIQLTDSGTGKNGTDTHVEGACKGTFCYGLASNESTAPAGGTNTCSGAAGHDGGPGGSGGTGGFYNPQGAPFYTWNAITNVAVGNPTSPTSQTAQGGSWGSAGSSGATGASGTSGANGSAMGVMSPSGYTPSDGTAGSDGAPGQGGGGSGGVTISSAYPSDPTKYDYGWGESGPGGGAGGCPGLAATAGKGGGASIAILAVQSAFTLDTVVIESSAGGSGGSAGAQSAPTNGGTGGKPAAHTWGGGSGGAGGNAGVSGNGGGGPSIGMAYQGTKPQLLASTVAPGAGGSGVASRVVNGQTIPASPTGLSQASYSF